MQSTPAVEQSESWRTQPCLCSCLLMHKACLHPGTQLVQPDRGSVLMLQPAAGAGRHVRSAPWGHGHGNRAF